MAFIFVFVLLTIKAYFDVKEPDASINQTTSDGFHFRLAQTNDRCILCQWHCGKQNSHANYYVHFTYTSSLHVLQQGLTHMC